MTDFNGYFVFKIFNGEKRDVKYIRNECLIATERGLIKGYIFTPINLTEGLPITTTQRNGDMMFTYIREKIERVDKKDVH